MAHSTFLSVQLCLLTPFSFSSPLPLHCSGRLEAWKRKVRRWLLPKRDFRSSCRFRKQKWIINLKILFSLKSNSKINLLQVNIKQKDRGELLSLLSCWALLYGQGWNPGPCSARQVPCCWGAHLALWVFLQRSLSLHWIVFAIPFVCLFC